MSTNADDTKIPGKRLQLITPDTVTAPAVTESMSKKSELSTTEDILRAVQQKDISPEEAVRLADTQGFTLLRDVDVGRPPRILPSGFAQFDRYSLLKDGEGELIILGARPSMGKSGLMFQLALNVSLQVGPVALFSLEMGNAAIKRRLLSLTTNTPAKELFSLNPGTFARHASTRLHGEEMLKLAKLFIYDESRSAVDNIVSKARDLNRHEPLRMVVVDYLQIIASRNLGNRNNEIGDVTAGLKGLASELGCPVIVGSQLNRAVETRAKDPRSGDRGDFRPQLSDLRDSGNIEQDADMVVFLSRPDYYNPENRPGEADIRIAKNRNGEVGDFVLNFSKPLTKFWSNETL